MTSFKQTTLLPMWIFTHLPGADAATLAGAEAALLGREEPFQEWRIAPQEGHEVGCLIECLKGHFHRTQPRLTEQQRAEQARRLQASLPEGTSISEQLVRLATDIQMVDSIALLPPSQGSDWVAINMYVDDQGAVKQLPPNVRAADILATCGVPQQAHGDVFIARLRDCEAQDIFERLDFKLSMMNSSADWVRQCQLAHRRAKGDQA